MSWLGGTGAQLESRAGAGTLRIRFRHGEQRPRAQQVLAAALDGMVRPETDPLALKAGFYGMPYTLAISS